MQRVAFALALASSLTACAGGDDGSDDPMAGDESSSSDGAEGESSGAESSSEGQAVAPVYAGCEPALSDDATGSLVILTSTDAGLFTETGTVDLRFLVVLRNVYYVPTTSSYGGLMADETVAVDADGAFDVTLEATDPEADPEDPTPFALHVAGQLEPDRAHGTFDYCEYVDVMPLPEGKPCSGTWEIFAGQASNDPDCG